MFSFQVIMVLANILDSAPREISGKVNETKKIDWCLFKEATNELSSSIKILPLIWSEISDVFLDFLIIHSFKNSGQKIIQQHYCSSVWLSNCAVKLYLSCFIDFNV